MRVLEFIKNFLRRMRRPVAGIEQHIEAGHSVGQEQQCRDRERLNGGSNVGIGAGATSAPADGQNAGINVGIGTTAPLVKLSVVGGRIAQDTWTADGRYGCSV